MVASRLRGMEPVVDDLERQAVADALVSNHSTLVESECRELVLAAQWADLHPTSSGTALPGTERSKRYGGEGTPFAGEFAAAELGVLLGRSHVAAATLMADALDVRHRLPRLWAELTAGHVRVWQARHVASRTRATGLTLAQARQVDDTTTPYLASLPWGRFLELLEARIIAADPEAAEARRIAAELERFVITGQSNEHGLKSLVAKATAGEVIYLVAMVDRIAEILLQQGDTDPVGVRRSKALGILAHPARALAMLQSAGSVDGDLVSTGSTTEMWSDHHDRGRLCGPRLTWSRRARPPVVSCRRRRCTCTCLGSRCRAVRVWRGWRASGRSQSDRPASSCATPT